MTRFDEADPDTQIRMMRSRMALADVEWDLISESLHLAVIAKCNKAIAAGIGETPAEAHAFHALKRKIDGSAW